MYKFEMSLFDNGEPEGFLFFMQNSNMVLNTPGMTTANAKLQYLRNLPCIESLINFDILCVQFGSTTMAHLNQVILGLGMYYFPVNSLSKKKIVMHNGIRKTRELKLRRCASHMIELG